MAAEAAIIATRDAVGQEAITLQATNVGRRHCLVAPPSEMDVGVAYRLGQKVEIKTAGQENISCMATRMTLNICALVDACGLELTIPYVGAQIVRPQSRAAANGRRPPLAT